MNYLFKCWRDTMYNVNYIHAEKRYLEGAMK